MNFKENYPNLFQFFNGYFADADIDLSDSEIVANYVSDCSEVELTNTQKELDDIIFNVEKYWKDLGEQANRFFQNSSDTLIWLNEVGKELRN